jgi:hypothetical protein
MAAALGTASAQDKIKACWIYVGPIGDHGWSYQHDQGRLLVEQELGDKVETVYLENVSEGPTRSGPSSGWRATTAPSSSPPRSASWKRRSRWRSGIPRREVRACHRLQAGRQRRHL